jgi:type I restriction enzyme S subunit
LTYGVIKLGPPVVDGIPILRSSNVRHLFIDEAGIKRIAPSIADQFARTYLNGGEILVTVRGTLGGVALVPLTMKGFNVSREVAVLPVESVLSAQYLAFAIGALSSQNWLSEQSKGVAYTGVNIVDLRLLPIPLPPLAEQHEIVRRVEALFKLADAIEKRVAAATARADKLTQAILAKAFRGELVPTEAELARREGRDFEPASVLLERVRGNRDGAVPAKKAGKKKATSR